MYRDKPFPIPPPNLIPTVNFGVIQPYPAEKKQRCSPLHSLQDLQKCKWVSVLSNRRIIIFPMVNSSTSQQKPSRFTCVQQRHPSTSCKWAQAADFCKNEALLRGHKLLHDISYLPEEWRSLSGLIRTSLQASH